MKLLIALLLVLYSFFLIRTKIPRLPARIPTHFNAAGQANGWGSPESLWHLLLAQILTCGLPLLIPALARSRPGMVHLGTRNLSDFTPAQRERIMPLLSDMVGSMSVLLGCLFCVLVRETIHAALSAHPYFSPGWVGVFLAGMAALLFYYLRRIYAAADS